MAARVPPEVVLQEGEVLGDKTECERFVELSIEADSSGKIEGFGS